MTVVRALCSASFLLLPMRYLEQIITFIDTELLLPTGTYNDANRIVCIDWDKPHQQHQHQNNSEQPTFIVRRFVGFVGSCNMIFHADGVVACVKRADDDISEAGTSYRLFYILS